MRVASCRPTTAGTPIDRARIAVCAVRVPASVASAARRDQSSCAATETGRSSATKTHGSANRASWAFSQLASLSSRCRLARTRPRTSFRSPWRSWRYGILDRAQPLHQLLARLDDGPLRVDVAGPDQGIGAFAQQRVGEHQQLHVEHRRRVRRRGRGACGRESPPAAHACDRRPPRAWPARSRRPRWRCDSARRARAGARRPPDRWPRPVRPRLR